MGKTTDSINIKFQGITSSLLLVAFIVLKLCNVISWSWWWVLAPAWIPIAIGIVILILIGIAFVLYYCIK